MELLPLVLAGVSRRVGERALVRDVTFTVAPGEVAALLGPSGAGKSTLLRVIAGLERPDHGTVALGDRALAGPAAWVPPEQRRIGLVFQDYALFPHMNVAGNVGFGLRRRSEAERAARVQAELAAVGLDHRANAYPHQLSGGEQQRVALARALATDPRAMLLDEPFAGLDPELRAEVRAVTLRRLRSAGVPVLMVTHDAEEALAVADTLLMVRAGRLVQAGAVGDVLAGPVDLGVARALGALNVITIQQPKAWDARLAGQRPMRLGVRPHHLWVTLSEGDAAPSGVVTGRAYTGGRPAIMVALQGGDVVTVSDHPSAAAPALGSAVSLGYLPENLLWFVGDGPEAPRLNLTGRA